MMTVQSSRSLDEQRLEFAQIRYKDNNHGEDLFRRTVCG